MESVPSEWVNAMVLLRPLLRVEVLISFCSLRAGIRIGEAKAETVHASVFAGADDLPHRLRDLLCRHRLSHQACMAGIEAFSCGAQSPQRSMPRNGNRRFLRCVTRR